MDRRLATRIDPSDIVQDTLMEAARVLPTYLVETPIAFYPWLRQIALRQIFRQHRRHTSRR